MAVNINVAIQPFRWEKLDDLLEVILRAAEADESDWRPGPGELAHMLRLPGYNAETDCFLAFSPDGQVVGYSDTDTGADPKAGQFWGAGAVHPAFRRQGIGALLLHAADERALEWANADVPLERPAYIQRRTLANETGTMTLMAAAGYHEVRRSYTMLIDLLEPVVAPPLPDGITLRPFIRDLDAHNVHEAVEEAFRDHWGHTDAPFDAWAHHHFEFPGFDPSLWVVAYDGDEVAGVCLGRTQSQESPEFGYITTLAVRRPWRKHGLGMALLKRGFQTLREYGFTEAGLGVDAQNQTNAVALYERAGMHVHKIHVLHRKMLRGNEADIGS
jgi:mycothiol synthase